MSIEYRTNVLHNKRVEIIVFTKPINELKDSCRRAEHLATYKNRKEIKIMQNECCGKNVTINVCGCCGSTGGGSTPNPINSLWEDITEQCVWAVSLPRKNVFYNEGLKLVKVSFGIDAISLTAGQVIMVLPESVGEFVAEFPSDLSEIGSVRGLLVLSVKDTRNLISGLPRTGTLFYSNMLLVK